MPRISRDGDTRTESRLYRRGLVLGLTLAEISLLLIFVLLLALGTLLKASETRAEQAERRARRAAAAEQSLHETLEHFSGRSNPRQVDQWVRDLVLSRARQDEIDQARKASSEQQEALNTIRGSAERAGAPPPASTPAAVAEAVSKQLGELTAMRTATAALRGKDKAGLERRILDTELENQAMRGTIANARRRLEALGKGTERPACWAAPDGRPEYIFDIGLSAGGFLIHDRKLPQRRDQEARLPIGMIRFDRTIDLPAFRAQTRPLFDWGESRGCRFFVVANDRTGSGQKEIFKQRLRGMEEHFYKFLSN